MTSKEECREKQDEERCALEGIFCGDFTDLRPKHDQWAPLDVKIELSPQKNSKISESFAQITLHVKCPKNYPKVPPKIYLEGSKGLKASELTELLSLLNKEAYCLRGEVMIFELCQVAETFLHDHSKPPEDVVKPPVNESFYDTMLKNKQKEKEQERRVQEQLKNDILKRKEQLLKESRVRRTTSESSPCHLSLSTLEDARSEVCDEHRFGETLYVPSTGRKIQKGACLGHSQKGCINYSGIDTVTGKLLYITEWSIKNAQLEARNLTAEEVFDIVEKKVDDLSKLRHKHLIGYECVLCVKKKDQVQIYLAQEFLLGISIFSISAGLGWCSEGASMVAKGVLEALIFLHNNGVSHGNLLDTTVFMDSYGSIRVTDFSIVPYLQELVSGDQPIADLPSLGTLIETLMPTPHVEMKDFINQCKSDRTLSGSDLLDHPFLFSINQHSKSPDQKPMNLFPPAERPQPSINVAAHFVEPLISSDTSRLKTEFETITNIGKGAYGDVLKVRNILDNRQYALKRIPLSAKNRQLYRKMTREVELLSRLNHENVVRYFNSWIETYIEPIKDEDDDDSEWSLSRKKVSSMIKTHSQNHLAALPTDEDSSDDDSFSPGWNNFIGNPGNDSDSDDGIEFQDSQGRAVQYEDESSEEDKMAVKGSGEPPAIRKKFVLYIQMEFCEKSTLRTAIDDNLYLDNSRLWKLFREIVEGLSHIHQQGMIHRDLKPVNIFLDSKDHVKIGDFGLATTNVLALQHQPLDANQTLNPKLNFGDSLTGQVGTPLYVAPELLGKASKSTYNHKVDLYSLGIIFFEMISPPLNTGMERIKTIVALRQQEVVLPKDMANNEKYKNEVKLLKWLLDHNPTKRPSSEELLQSELVPPAKIEGNELQEMLRQVLANPQSRSYKHLISKCLAQESDTVCQLTYHTGMVPISSLFENVKNKIINIMRKHGAIDVAIPLLTPYTKATTKETTVKLMCHSGSVVTLPHDLRDPFLRHVALNGIVFLRRYSIGRIYREKKAYNFHPKQSFEFAFDIVTSARGIFLVDAEILVVANEIIREFPMLKERNFTFRINHAGVLRAILQHYSVPTNKYKILYDLLSEFHEGKLSRLNIKEAVKSMLPGKEQILDLLLIVDCPITAANSTILKVLRGQNKSSAINAIRELESIISLCQAMGVDIPFHLCFGMTSGLASGNIFWQMVGELKIGKLTVFASGGRFDNILEEYKKTGQRAGIAIVNREMYCTGLSLAIDKVVLCLQKLNDINCLTAVVDLLIIVAFNSPMKQATSLLKNIWAAGIKCCLFEAPNGYSDEEQLGKELGANHLIIFSEQGLRAKTWTQNHYSEGSLTSQEIVEHLKRNLSLDITDITEHQNQAIQRNNSITSFSTKNYETPANGLPTLDVIFVTLEKFNLNKRKRLENQIEQKLENVMQKFNKKETFAIFAVELEMKHVKSLIGCIDPCPNSHSENELDVMLERFPKHRQKYLHEIYDEIIERMAKNKNSDIVGIFSVPDSYCRLIL